MARVSLQKVSKHFDGRRLAVRDLNLEVADKELIVIVGPSGCGKSTTLRLIAGLEVPSKGTIQIGESLVCEVDERGICLHWQPPHQRRVGMVFQHSPLYPHMTVRQNMRFGFEIRNRGWWRHLIWQFLEKRWRKSWFGREKRNRQEVNRPETDLRKIDERINELADWLEIVSLLDLPVAGLSGGERQRVAVGRALSQDNSVVLLDEPFANLDAALRRTLQRRFRDWQQRHGCTAIWVTHDQSEALFVADRLVVVDAGTVEQVGEPSQLFESPKSRFVAGFVGEPPMNLLPVECRRVSVCSDQEQTDGVEKVTAEHQETGVEGTVSEPACKGTMARAPTPSGARMIGQIRIGKSCVYEWECWEERALGLTCPRKVAISSEIEQHEIGRGEISEIDRRIVGIRPQYLEASLVRAEPEQALIGGVVSEKMWLMGEWFVVVDVNDEESVKLTCRASPNVRAEDLTVGCQVKIQVNWSKLVMLPASP